MANVHGNRFLERLRRADRPLVIAHRGASAGAPENTLLAARRGWEVGAAAWEFDVHLSGDGHPVVVHDESLRRTTDVERRFAGDARGLDGFPVAQFSLEEIRSLDAGSWFLEAPGRYRSASDFGTHDQVRPDDRDAIRSGTVRVPTLAEALELTRELDWLANVELKTFPNLQPELLDKALAQIDRLGVADRVLISSFNLEDVARVRGRRGDIATGALFDAPLYHPWRYLREIVRADCAHPSREALGAASEAYRRDPGPESLRGDLTRSLREAEIPVLVYTVNDTRPRGLARHLAEIGVSAIFTDRPAELMQFMI